MCVQYMCVYTHEYTDWGGEGEQRELRRLEKIHWVAKKFIPVFHKVLWEEPQ